MSRCELFIFKDTSRHTGDGHFAAPGVQHILRDPTFRRLEIEEVSAIHVREHRCHDRPARRDR